MNTDTKIQFSAEFNNWPNRGSTFEAAGHEIFFIDEGEKDKPVIFLIHGFPTSSWDWQLIWATLQEKYRLVALDLLGFGYSDKPNQRNYTIHKQADIVEALVEHLDLKSFHVLAHDYGDTVAQELLSRQLDGTGKGVWHSCCLLNGGLFPETHKALFAQKLLLSPLGPVLNYILGRKQFGVMVKKIFGQKTQPNDETLDEFWALINIKDGKHLFHNVITYMRDRIEHRERWVLALKNANVPIGLINGSADPVSGVHMVQRYQELGCRLDYLAELKDIGHYPQVEAPAEVAQHYLKFLKDIVAQ